MVLCKSPIIFSDKQQCITLANKYKPSVDLIESLNRLQLVIEPCICVNARIHSIHSSSIKVTLDQCQSFDQCIMQRGTLVRMPWTVDAQNGPLYIYCILDNDEWFYSQTDSLDDAYHQYIHCT